MVTAHDPRTRIGRPQVSATRFDATTAVERAHSETTALRGIVASSLLLAACFCYYVTTVSVGWGNSVCDFHGFRQSQTAISVAALLRGGPWLIYWTPVLGPPWTIPFEFPLYQWIVAVLVGSTSMALDPAGRLVSVAFFLLTLWPTERLLSALRVRLPGRLLVLSLLLSSPFYIFWSRTFLIESTALFLAVWSLACTVWAIRRPSPWRLAAMCVVGGLAAVVKITTFFPFLIASLAVVVFQVCRLGGPLQGSRLARRGLWVAACAGVPALALITWTHAADRAKSESIQGQVLTSTNLKTWNFGTLDQRLSSETWAAFGIRAEQPVGRSIAFVCAALGLVMARRRFAEVAGCVALYGVPILTFTNLYFIHEYYYFANNIFLVVAMGLSIVAMLEAGRPLRDGAIGGLILLLGSMAYTHHQYYRPYQTHNETSKQALGAAIRERTEPDDVIVLLGFDWSSEVPYYSDRRAYCLPDWASPGTVAASIQSLSPYRIGAVSILPPAQRPITKEALLALLQRQGFEPKASPVDAPFELLVRADRPDSRSRQTAANRRDQAARDVAQLAVGSR